jgi:hypothetical protein
LNHTITRERGDGYCGLPAVYYGFSGGVTISMASSILAAFSSEASDSDANTTPSM